MNRALVCLFSLLTLSSFAHAQLKFICPDEGKKIEVPGIVLADVMYQFRDHLNRADAVMDAGSNNPGAITINDLKNVSADLTEVQNCAAYVVDHYNTQMAPKKSQGLAGEDKQKFLQEFLFAMGNFYELVKDYHACTNALSLKSSAKDYDGCVDKALAVRDAANQAHRKF